jgi:hypothetical protein
MLVLCFMACLISVQEWYQWAVRPVQNNGDKQWSHHWYWSWPLHTLQVERSYRLHSRHPSHGQLGLMVLPPGFFVDFLWNSIYCIRAEENSTFEKSYTLPNLNIYIVMYLYYRYSTLKLIILYMYVVALVSDQKIPCHGYLLLHRISSLFYLSNLSGRDRSAILEFAWKI